MARCRPALAARDAGHDRQVDGGEPGDRLRGVEGVPVCGAEPGPPHCRQRKQRGGQHHGQRHAPGPIGRRADQAGHGLAEHDQDEDLEPVGQVPGVDRDPAGRRQHGQRAHGVGEQRGSPDGIPERAVSRERAQPQGTACPEEDQVTRVERPGRRQVVAGPRVQRQLQAAHQGERDDEPGRVARQGPRCAGGQGHAQQDRGQEGDAVCRVLGLVPVGVERELDP